LRHRYKHVIVESMNFYIMYNKLNTTSDKRIEKMMGFTTNIYDVENKED